MKILIKLSGESLAGISSAVRHDEPTLALIAEQIVELQKQSLQIALVVGGGNLFRGSELTGQLSIERSTADYIGMLATVQNALILRDFFESKGIETRVSSAIAMPQICEAYMPKRARRHLEKGRVVIFAAGLGVPYFTTDTTAVQRALEIHADILILAKNGINGLYTSDPSKSSNAQFIKEISASSVLDQNLRALDQAAIVLAKDHELTMKIVGISDIAKALSDETGTIIHPK